MQTGAVIRFCAVCVICVTVLLYNISDILSTGNIKIFNETEISENAEIKTEVIKTEQKEESKKTQEKVQSQVTSSKQETKTESKTESVAASAKAIKGKILSQYISPYKASLSYNSVYMKNSTDLKIDLKELLNSSISFKIAKNSDPQVLIIHTHATETYMTENTDYFTEEFSSRSRDNSRNMTKIGEIVAKKLNNAGIKTLQDKTQHDYPNYTGSYSRAADTICSYLKKYPSIKVVLDLHRDAVTAENGDKVKLVTEIEGKKAAQVMLVMGSQSGSVTNFPKWKENLKLAVKLQQILEVKYPSLARPLSLNSKNYNESLTTGSLLLEFGTDANTLEEASYSAELVGNALAQLLNDLK